MQQEQFEGKAKWPFRTGIHQNFLIQSVPDKTKESLPISLGTG